MTIAVHSHFFNVENLLQRPPERPRLVQTNALPKMLNDGFVFRAGALLIQKDRSIDEGTKNLLIARAEVGLTLLVFGVHEKVQLLMSAETCLEVGQEITMSRNFNKNNASPRILQNTDTHWAIQHAP